MKRLSFLPIIVIFSLIPVSALAAQKITPGSTCKVLKQKVVKNILIFGKIKTYQVLGKNSALLPNIGWPKELMVFDTIWPKWCLMSFGVI
jgi:hypothetical protein